MGHASFCGLGFPFAMTNALPYAPAHKPRTSRRIRFLRLVLSTFDPRAWLHAVKIVNYYNYSHVKPLRQVSRGRGCNISPNAAFFNAGRISLGSRVTLGARVTLMAGPSQGRITIGDDTLFAPDVMVTAAGYRFNDGTPVTRQAMDEADVAIGKDVWLGAKVIVLPGSRIGDGAIVAAGAVVRGKFPPKAIVGGVPARILGARQPD